MYDIVFIGDIKKFNVEWQNLKNKFPFAKHALDISSAQHKTITEMLWVVWPDIILEDEFDFSYKVDEWSKQYVHVFKNGNLYDGIALVPKSQIISDKEFNYRFYISSKQVDLIASYPKPYDFFIVDTYDDYLYALKNSTTEMFWMSSANINHDRNLVQNYYISHHDSQLRNQTHAFIHRVNDQHLYNGLFLCSKRRELSKREVEYRFPVNRIEHEHVGSGPISYDVFEIDSYDEYLQALENSTTEMFWMSSRNISATIPDLYFTHDNEYDRKQNHNFLHCGDKRNGVFLCSKHRPLTQKEIEHRFLVNAKEWDIEASNKVEYPVYEIDSYDEYIQALENSPTEMFWMSSRNISATIPDLYFTHDNEYDRKQNHAFIHRVGDRAFYNGLFLCSKHRPLTQKEVDFRHVVNRKEWDIVGSGPISYDVFEIDSYDEYLQALENSTTEMFWMSSRNIDAIIPDIYFTHDNEYDRKQNHAFQHEHNNEIFYNGLFLCSKYVPLTKKEVDFRYPVARKEWNIVASKTKKYQVFATSNYQDYLDAYRNSQEDMFWIVPNHIEVLDNFKFDLCFGHHEQYDKRINHVFLNGNYHDGIILCSKKSRITQKEFDYNFIGNKKEYNIVASRPKLYDVVFISYQEPNADINYQKLLEKHPTAKRVHGIKGIHAAHIEAAKLCNTEMFFVVDGDAEILQDFSFDYQVPRWDHDVVHVWRSQNPINNLIYGYGGIKLLPRTLTINMDTSKPDMTTSISSKFKAVQEISNITAFNTDPFNTWKSAFRECVKLSSKTIDRQKDSETIERLQIWCSAGNDKLYGDYAILGALMGSKYGSENINNIEKLKRINNFDWLKEQFDGIV